MNKKEKNAIVTGGTNGIGLAITKALTALGVSVIVIDIDKEVGEKLAKEHDIISVCGYHYRIYSQSEYDWLDVYGCAVYLMVGWIPFYGCGGSHFHW